MKRLLIVEDDAGIRQSLADYFGSRDWECVAVASAEAAEREQAGAAFAAVLLDLRLPQRDGLEWLAALRRRGDRTPIIAVTARGEEEQRIRGLQAGADDYLVKPFSVRELEARLLAVLRRTGTPAARVRIGGAEVDLDGHEVRRGGVRHELVAKERDLLAFFLANPGRTLDRGELLRAVWGYDALPTTRTVDTHVFHLRQKLEERPDAPRHLLTVHGVGYRLVLDP